MGGDPFSSVELFRTLRGSIFCSLVLVVPCLMIWAVRLIFSAAPALGIVMPILFICASCNTLLRYFWRNVDHSVVEEHEHQEQSDLESPIAQKSSADGNYPLTLEESEWMSGLFSAGEEKGEDEAEESEEPASPMLSLAQAKQKGKAKARAKSKGKAKAKSRRASEQKSDDAEQSDQGASGNGEQPNAMTYGKSNTQDGEQPPKLVEVEEWQVMMGHPDDDGGWQPFDEQSQTMLRAARAAGETSCRFEARGFEYDVRFDSMEQINLKSGRRRAIRVIKTARSSARSSTAPASSGDFQPRGRRASSSEGDSKASQEESPRGRHSAPGGLIMQAAGLRTMRTSDSIEVPPADDEPRTGGLKMTAEASGCAKSSEARQLGYLEDPRSLGTAVASNGIAKE